MYERKLPSQEVFARRNIQMGDSLRLRANRTVRLLKANDEGRTLGDDEISPARALFINALIKLPRRVPIGPRTTDPPA